MIFLNSRIMSNFNFLFWKAGVLTTVPPMLIFCFGPMLPITFYNEYYLLAFLTTQFYIFFSFLFVSLTQSKKWGLGKTSHRKRESWWQWLNIIKLSIKAIGSISRWSDSTYLILVLDIMYVLKFYFLTSFFYMYKCYTFLKLEMCYFAEIVW